ncbi:MAG: AAA domain (dynein-related subfamily) [halophilic archaeon J07HB67]|jgi:AAA ATPase containing von Willebrand factor type A (vWA) domain|nr:MAG: AAA domain (dynein-related subfamily) [halophilic archaeon J07HB67]
MSDRAVSTDGGSVERVASLTRSAGTPTAETYHGLPVLDDPDHPLVPDPEHTYIERDLRDRTDVELAAGFLADESYALLLRGETGVGKNRLIRQLCARTNRPLVRVNFGSGTTYAELVGEYAPDETAEETRIDRVESLTDRHDLDAGEAASLVGAEHAFSFSPGILYRAVRHGWTFVADELNAAGPAATMPLHGLTERDGQLVVKPTAEVLDPHPQFRFVATTNPPQYAGTNRLNDAFRSRFWELRLDYLSPAAERRLLYETTDLQPGDDRDERIADRLTELAASLRASHRNRDIATPTSHRAVIKIGRLVTEFGLGPEAAAKQVLEARATVEDRTAVAKAIESIRWA